MSKEQLERGHTIYACVCVCTHETAKTAEDWQLEMAERYAQEGKVCAANRKKRSTH